MIQLPLRVAKRHQRLGRTQFAALPWRITGDSVEFCLVTSRGRGRWILPKGWPMDGATPAEAAATEAREEAGLVGLTEDRCLGVWSFVKGGAKTGAPHFAMVFPVQVTQVLADWPERGQRRRKWFTRERAAAKLDAPELRQIVLAFDPAPQRPLVSQTTPHAAP
ncbi:NUDIX hydrolase [uncultured Limimaricola sp.]|uniref:NUDIX hydrolase n=1 Tax=uncultured Limimaricola sp. TaxID=2211667 RepID=UPI0030F51F8D